MPLPPAQRAAHVARRRDHRRAEAERRAERHVEVKSFVSSLRIKAPAEFDSVVTTLIQPGPSRYNVPSRQLATNVAAGL